MKTVRVIRGGQPFPLTLGNGDSFDSTIDVSDNTMLPKHSPYVNTDPTITYKGGILAEGNYKYICGIRPDNQKKVLFLYQATDERDAQIKGSNDLTIDDMTFKSLVPNPNWNMEYKITQVLIHSSGVTTDGSEGCITVYYTNFIPFIELFELNEKGIFILNRNPNWVPNDPLYKSITLLG